MCCLLTCLQLVKLAWQYLGSYPLRLHLAFLDPSSSHELTSCLDLQECDYRADHSSEIDEVNADFRISSCSESRRKRNSVIERPQRERKRRWLRLVWSELDHLRRATALKQNRTPSHTVNLDPDRDLDSCVRSHPSVQFVYQILPGFAVCQFDDEVGHQSGFAEWPQRLVRLLVSISNVASWRGVETQGTRQLKVVPNALNLHVDLGYDSTRSQMVDRRWQTVDNDASTGTRQWLVVPPTECSFVSLEPTPEVYAGDLVEHDDRRAG